MFICAINCASNSKCKGFYIDEDASECLIGETQSGASSGDKIDFYKIVTK